MEMLENAAPKLKKTALIVFVVLIPILGGWLGWALGAELGMKSFWSETGMKWMSLGKPAGGAQRLAGLCDQSICVENVDEKLYSNCGRPGSQSCWVEASADKLEFISPHLYNPCMFELEMPVPPADAIQIVGSKTCGSGGDIYDYYALLEDGSVWKWYYVIPDVAGLAVIPRVLGYLALGFLAGLLLAIPVFVLAWRRI